MLLAHEEAIADLVGEDGLDALQTAALGLERVAPGVRAVQALTAMYTARAWEFLVQDTADGGRWHLSLGHEDAALRIRAVGAA